METYLGIDWGGTYIKAGLVDRSGSILKSKVFESSSFLDKKCFINALKYLVISLEDFKPKKNPLSKKSEKIKIKAVGIGAPGIIDVKKGFIYYLPNVLGWERYPLKATLEKSLNLPVYVNNDANLFALAESRIGAAKGKSRVLFFTLGTGLGGAIIIEGRILEGRTSATELAHVPINLKGARCGCGSFGCIETYTGNRYLLKRYKAIKKGKTEVSDIKTIYLRAKNKEKEALLLWEEFSYNFGRYLSGMINIFNPEIIVLGGGVSGAIDVFKPMLLKVINQFTVWPHLKDLKIVPAKVKNAGIVGAAFLAKEALSKESIGKKR
ncbi:MAG: ROK family protein [Candidatus Omnitrophica bacterium]|nr:ROK family protein [Candidatus Omnitrophota bacterium]